jgi:20S proteasome alpha/beta subunit
MTLILALKGREHVITAGDTLEMREANAATYCQSRQKIKPINGDWVIGVSGSLDGMQVVEDLGNKKITNPTELVSSAVQQISDRLLDLYRRKKFKGVCWFLLSGVSRGQPFIWNWNFVEENGEVICEGPREQQDFAAIGTCDHGGLYFTHQFWRPGMTTGQTSLLGLHCVSEVANHDPRVDGPFTVGIAEEGKPPTMRTGKELTELLVRSRAITTNIQFQFSNIDITI